MPRLFLILALVCAAWGAADEPEPAPYVHAVEFPFEQIPRALWERELVWLKNIGINTVAFPMAAEARDWQEFLSLLRRLDLKAWVRGPSPVPIDSTQLSRHGGPIAFIQAPPGRVATVSATDPLALVRSRQALAAGNGALLWVDVEDTLYPSFRKGAVSLSGDERAGAAALRRSAYLLRHWAPVLASMQPQSRSAVRPASGAFPSGVSAVELSGKAPDGPSAVSIVNQGKQPFAGALRVRDMRRKSTLVLPRVTVPPGQALWLPVDVPFNYSGLCQDCSGFARRDRIVYATAELQTVEYENGILAMEFSAPTAGEAVIELSAQPVGLYLAAGSPTEFDWDAKTFMARLPIPAGRGPEHRVRVGLAIEAPLHTGFFVNPARLLFGRANIISTSYSSPALATRSRLLVPPGYLAEAKPKSPTEIDYSVKVPATALHGEFVEFALEADGVRLGRTRLQVFRPASVRLREAASLHFGDTELKIEPPLVSIDPRAGRSLDVIVRNNSPAIETFTTEMAGRELEFMPQKAEISIGAIAERSVSPRVMGSAVNSGIYQAQIRLGGSAQLDQPVRVVAIRRGEALAYSLDLDGDNSPEWVLENQKVRAVFSARDGGRWLEFVWKDTNINVLPEAGGFPGSGPVEFSLTNGRQEASLQITGRGWRRRVTLNGADAQIRVEQDVPLPAETLTGRKLPDLWFQVARPAANQATYALERAPAALK